MEAKNLFAKREVEEDTKQESTMTFTPGEVPNVLEAAEEQPNSKTVAPTPEQIIAIKVWWPFPKWI